MAGSREQGLKAAETNRKRYGENFYGKIGEKGGKASHGGAFTVDRELAREAGRKGGAAPRRKRKPDGSFSQEFYETPDRHTNFLLQSFQRVADDYSE